MENSITQFLTTNWPLIVGFIYAVVVGQLMTSLVVEELYLNIGVSRREVGHPARATPWIGPTLGNLEAALYFTAWCLNVEEFIAVWFVFKMAGRWQGWANLMAEDDRTKDLPGTIFSIFTIGSGHILAYAVVGAYWVDLQAQGHQAEGMVILVVLVILSMCYWLVIQKRGRNWNMRDYTKWTRRNLSPEGTPEMDEEGKRIRHLAEDETARDLQKPLQQLLCDFHEEVHQHRMPDDNILHAMKRMVSMMTRVALTSEDVTIHSVISNCVI